MLLERHEAKREKCSILVLTWPLRARCILVLEQRKRGYLMEKLSLLTWKEIAEVDKDKSILFVTMAPIEAHGISLPLATDLLEGECWSKNAMLQLEHQKGYQCFYLNEFPIASASVSDFYGCIHFSMKTTFTVAKELLENLIHFGFKNIVVVASHADPVHQIAVEKAIEKVNRHYGVRAISPLGAFFSSKELKITHDLPELVSEMENKNPNDFHAGWIETSCILAMDEKLVRTGFKQIPMTSIREKEMISKKKMLRAMGEYGHLGNPAVANKEVGEALNQEVADFIVEAVVKFVERTEYKKYMHHYLYRIPTLHIGLFINKRWIRKRRR